MITNHALATLGPWKGVARDGPLITAEFCGARVPLGALLCTMTNGLRQPCARHPRFREGDTLSGQRTRERNQRRDDAIQLR
jgi:hypothetical protein